MIMPLSGSRRLLRAAAVPVLLGTLPALAFAASAGGALPGATSGSHAQTTASPTQLATAFVRSQQVVAPGGAVRAFAPVADSRYRGSIDTRSQAAVNSAYWSTFASAVDLPTDWTGSVAACQPGATSSASEGATLSSLNFVRRLAGLAPVRFSGTLNSHAQAAALMMSANDALDHSPPSSWRCYSTTGARAAARSNLALAHPDITSGEIVEMYMDDIGASNYGVGHRRWVLNPFATTMGSGSTGTANALQVIGPTRPGRPNPAYVPWPTGGWFPDSLEPQGRWSLSAGNARTDFRRARIHVSHAGQSLAVHKYPLENGYGRPTVVWQMPSGFAKSGSYQVVVKNIRHRGSSKRFTARYTVRFFTPTR
jgi:uncharacterized protein YkwD